VDVIVFNEMLYHSRRPVELVRRYCTHLRTPGRVIVSMFETEGNRWIWSRLATLLRRVDGVRITNDLGQLWQVGLFEPRAAMSSEN
jgi:hypothetical protein